MYGLNYDNPWIGDVMDARRRAPAWAVFAIGAVFALFMVLGARGLTPVVAGAAGAVLAGLSDPWPAVGAYAAIQLLLFGLLLAVALGASRFEGRSAWRAGRRPRLAALGGFTLGIGGFCACAGLALLVGAVEIGAAPPIPSPAARLLVGLGLVAFQAASEEVYFRGWLQPVCCARWGPWLGLGAASLLFALLHLAGGAHGGLALLNLVLAGLMFGLLALRTGGLWAPAAAHFAWNWADLGLLGVDPIPTGALFAAHARGPALWSGGSDTLGGGLAATLILAAIVTALVCLRPNPSARPAACRSDRAL